MEEHGSYYRVVEIVARKNIKGKPFITQRDFKGNDMDKCQWAAEDYYLKRLNGSNMGKYFTPNVNLYMQVNKRCTYSIEMYYMIDSPKECLMIPIDQINLLD